MPEKRFSNLSCSSRWNREVSRGGGVEDILLTVKFIFLFHFYVRHFFQKKVPKKRRLPKIS